MDSSSQRLTVLHYLGYNADVGGIISAVRAMASASLFDCVLGVNPGFQQRRDPPLPTLSLSPISAERLNLETFWKARKIAGEIGNWLHADERRRLHAHSRAGLAVAWWMRRRAASQTVVSVHCFGRQRWFYRAAARHFGAQIFWLTPAMRDYYGIKGFSDWEQCIPSAVTPIGACARRSRHPGDPIVFGGIGGIVPWKGWHLILDAFSRLDQATLEKARFRHLGSAEETAESKRYEGQLRRHPISVHSPSLVEWCGQQASADGFLKEIDCLIVSSVNEPLSLAMIEALRAGIPVLRANSGGALDTIVPGENGWLFRSGDPADLANWLSRLIITDALSQTHVLPESIERFAAPVVAEQWLRVYQRRAE